jgi:phosphomethylpyrimidine synthase
MDVDTDFCAMCGHDWCSMRISKEIQEFASGKVEEFQPARASMRSPGLTEDQARLLAKRGKKQVCHSDLVADEAEAKRVHEQLLRTSGK